MLDSVLNGANLCFALAFAIMGFIFKLYKEAQDEKFKGLREYFNERVEALELRHNEFKNESKDGDVEGKEEIRRVDNVRVDQITKIHVRVDKFKDDFCSLAQRVANIEGRNTK